LIYTLPLSWSQKDLGYPNYSTIILPLSRYHWVALGDIPRNYEFEEVYESYLRELKSGFIIRGCGKELKDFLLTKGCECLYAGAEAVINIGNLTTISSSLKALVKRGNNVGYIREVSLESVSGKNLIQKLIEKSKYANSPYLIHLFRTNFTNINRCFVFNSDSDEMLALISISCKGNSYMQLELMIRDSNAPVGVMESLIFNSLVMLSKEGNKYFSLGEVPFVSYNKFKNEMPKYSSRLKQSLYLSLGQLFKFAFDYDGLFSFKNKFSPQWEPVYICAKPGMSYLSLIDMFIKTRYLQLVCSKLF